MDQHGADEPWHERSIFDWIPEPPAAPAELVVSPETSERAAASQKHPRDRGPGPRPARPSRIKPSANQCRNRKGKRDREANVAHVEHRRVGRAHGLLQEGS